MGTVFGFVSSDVKAKIDILEMLRQKHDDGTNFESFSSMLEFEKSSGLLSKSDYVSGSRTLLRLHRGLGKWPINWIWQYARTLYSTYNAIENSFAAFIYEFLNKLHQIEPHEKTNGVCKAAYNDTLAQYHPWIVRQGDYRRTCLTFSFNEFIFDAFFNSTQVLWLQCMPCQRGNNYLTECVWTLIAP